jgi:hypothetical protein
VFKGEIMSALMEVWHAVQAIVQSADYYTLGAAVVIIIAAGFMIEGIRSAVPATLGALIVFALVKFILALTIGHAKDIEVLATTDWRLFADMKVLVLLAYSLVFGVLIAAVSAIKSLIR